jgi:hypothetical protein
MREAVQLGAEVEVVGVAGVAVGSARTAGSERAMEAQKGVIFMVASVGEARNKNKEMEMGMKRV